MKARALGCVLGSLSIWVFIAHSSISAAPARFRALVEASKDGGTWWFPQGPPSFDSNREHQGKIAADSMRARGWEVVELPRGDVITSDKLEGFDVLIRPTPFFAYSESEAAAYRDAVAAGAQLLLMGSAGGDRVAEGFGLRFDRHSRLSPVIKIIPNALTAETESLGIPAEEGQKRVQFKVVSVWSLEIPWVVATEMPDNAVVLAWVGDRQSDAKPVLGYFPYGKGYVVFIGAALGIYGQGRGWRDKLLAFLERQSSVGPTMETPIFIEVMGPAAPALIKPENGAILPQPGSGSWFFEWESAPEAQTYQIIVLGPHASIPVINIETGSPALLVPRKGSYIVGRNLRGWTWRVRVQDKSGRWGSWSETRFFKVRPGDPRREK